MQLTVTEIEKKSLEDSWEEPDVAVKSYKFYYYDSTIKYSGAFNSKDGPVYISKVMYNDPATIVFWSDGTKTMAKCHGGDEYSAETGLAICTLKKIVGGVKVFDLFRDWLPDGGNIVSLKDVRRKNTK